MPPKAQEKKGGLTLDKLSRYDDILTDALVDKIYYWTTIRKNRGTRFAASRGLAEEDLADIIRKHIILAKDPAEAAQHLLELPGLRRFVAELRDPKEKDHFNRHLLRYVKIYMPDCPFEVTTTNRYTINDHEASVTARRAIKPREEIKYLTGVRVAMTEEEEKKIELARKDFSMVISSRKKTRSLFLGPARFANHDCDANSRLSTTGHDGMQIVAVKHIASGEEITVSYGEDYFGDNNEECLCQSCEDRLVNGWAPLRPVDEEDEEENGAIQKEATSSKRKRASAMSTDDNDQHDAMNKKVKMEEGEDAHVQTSISPPSPTRPLLPKPLRHATLKKAYSSSSLRQEIPISSIEDPIPNLTNVQPTTREMRNQQWDGQLALVIDESPSSRNTTPQSSATAASPKSDHSTDATSVDEDIVIAGNVAHDAVAVKPSLGVATIKMETTITKTLLPPILRPALEEEDSSSELSELSSSYELDDVLKQVVKRKQSKTPPATRSTRARSRNEWNRAVTPKPVDDSTKYVENPRKPGDYGMSQSLTAIKDSRWKECHTCEDWFVQQNGYQTRRECPRCERHSKLYGYAWPKTDREGKHDKDVRVLDHRKVHRFVDAEEEKTVKKSKKALQEAIANRFSTPRSFRDSSISTEADSGRNRRRLRQTM